MAESLVLPVVRGVVSKAADALIKKVTAMWGIDGDRHKLERHLVYVQSLLTDAEVKSETNHAVRMWMKELKAAAYQADDVLDDFQYEALRREALSDQSMTSKVLSNFTSKNRLVFRYKASRDLKKVLDKINELVAEMNTFGLVVLKEAPTMQALPRQTHSALDESMEIFGRDDDKEVVVKLLLEQQDRQDVQVLPIIGMGGVGKTTLAKMVYNNRKIQKHFELKMWHCVSENFEAIPLVRSVIELATNSRCDLPDTIELLRGRLQEAIGRKRFLLILDDVWNENPNKWEDGLKPLLCFIGGSGSMIVVTTRSQRVALIMGTLPTHELACLSEDDSWELFSKKAFSKGVQEEADLVRIGKRISNKCEGLPLALKTMGGLMSSKQKVQEWEAIADCTISDTSRGKDEVMSILKLSYNHLPPEMKQCFAFCAVFPKDYEIEKDMLIQLWMANGYIQEEGTMDLAQKGEFVFNELAWRSFLQDVISMRRNYGRYDHSSKSELNCCIMHDLMHDLAKDVANECATSEELIQQKVSINGVCHLRILGSLLWDEIKQLLRDSIYMRTLLIHEPPFWDYQDLLKSKLMPSRALSFYYTDTAIVHRQLTHAAHLRYLDLSDSRIISLPNSICMMYNLQSLRLNNCSQLQYLPEGMRTMRKLSHIYLFGCGSLKRMPPKLSLLHNLRTLTTFVVDTQDGCGIEELEGLQQLGNRLELYNLKKVKCGSKVNLHEKQNLNELLLYWGRTCQPDDKPTIDDANNHEQVLESLVPHGELKTLEVHGYGGLTISQWMRNPQMFRCLRELIMSNCPWCKDLPIVWLSSSLEHLSLYYMKNLTTLYNNIDVEAGGACKTSMQIFPKLKRMELMQLPELENNSSVIFPQLEKLEIRCCDKLSSLPETPVLTDLQLTYSGKKGSLSICMPLGRFSSLVGLQIEGFLVDVVVPPDGQQSQSQSPLDTLRYLWLEGAYSFISILNKSKLKLGLQDCFVLVEELVIRSCSNIVRWPVEELRCFPRLRSLCIGYCSKLEGNGSSCEEEEILPLPQLERLEIYSCDSLIQIPKLPASLEKISIEHSGSLAALPSNLGDLAKLRELFVWNCGALKALPADGMDGLTSLERLTISWCPGIEKFPRGLLQRLPALKSLTIWDCPDLQRRCREGGEYFDLVASIPVKGIPAPVPKRKKLVKWLPSCGGGSQSN